jgi:hypothetical protein
MPNQTPETFAKGKPYPASKGESFPREPWFSRRDAKAYGVVLDTQARSAGAVRRSAFPR